jgi:hypothetical protein
MSKSTLHYQEKFITPVLMDQAIDHGVKTISLALKIVYPPKNFWTTPS